MKEIDQLRQTVATLRSPGGCPWDQEQTHQSLASCLIEECAELLETMDQLDMPHMREELGDVLLQVVYHSQLAEEKGSFTLEEVVREINEKLIRRHPHVFGNSQVKDTDGVLKQWEEIKAKERGAMPEQSAAESLFKDLPAALPALLYATQVYKQIHKKEILPADHELRVKAREVAGEMEQEEELGARLFILASAAREKGWDPESALRRYTRKKIQQCEDEK